MDKNDLDQRREAFHAKVREELRSIPVPPDLRERILRQRPRSNVIRVNFSRRIVAIAASVALLGTALFFWTRPSAEDRTFAGFQNRMTAFAVRQYSMDFRTRDLQEARNRLAALNAPSDFQLTAGLSAAPVKGGAKLSWQGTPVTMVCFDGPDAKILYLFIVPSQTFDSAPGEGKLETVKGLACATWSSAGKTYLLAADIPKQELRAYL